jgi:two-component system, NtrC family, sensor kinase
MTWKKTIWFRLALGTVAVIVVANAALAAIVLFGIGRVLVEEVQTRVRLDLNSARTVYADRLQRIGAALEVAAFRASVPEPLRADTLGDLAPVLDNVRRSAGIDVLTLLDTQGRVLYRAHNPGRSGDDLSGNRLVARALRERRAASGSIVVEATELERDGRELAERARVAVPPASGGEEVSAGLLLGAAVPLVDMRRPDVPAAWLYGAELLNRKFEIVDAIKDDVFQNQQFEGRDAGTATIFLGDVRVATNVRTPDGQRAVGTRMSAEVRRRVLVEGASWAARAFVVHDWFITAYEPIRDPDGRVIGALYVGVLEAPYLATRRALLVTFLATIAATTLVSLALLFFVTRAMLRPISRVVAMAERVIGGDLTARTGLSPPGEMGALCRAIDAMADAVDQRERRLKAQAREQLGRSEQLAAVGRLAAGVAHEVNNPLTGVLTFAHLTRSKENLDGEDRQALDVIIRETTRVREIVRGMLEFARETPCLMRVLDLNETLRQVLDLVRRQKEFRELTLRETYHPEPLAVWGDRSRLQQVFLNLLMNAAQAMPHGGRLTVATGLRDERVFVSVADTGTGISAVDRPRIFEPFYTTKPVGSGTGLGLSISQGIVEQHKGTIEVDSEEGHGATFTVRLPRAPQGAAPEPGGPAAEAERPKAEGA